MSGGAAAVIQARLGSQRLPGKVLADLAGRPVLGWVVDACTAAELIDLVIVTVPEGDDTLRDVANALGVTVVAGPEDDLIARYQTAAARAGTDALVRITADCPLLDPAVIDRAVRTFANDPVDYQETRGYPRGAGDADVMDAASLLTIDSAAATSYEREHLGPWFLDPSHGSRVRFMDAPESDRRPDLRVCVDEQADLDVVREIVARVGSRRPSIAELIAVLDGDVELRHRNAHVQQRS